MSFQSDPAHIQEVSLAGVTAIEIQAARLDLIIEADPEFDDDVARLLADSGADAPELSLSGSRLRVTQVGRYRGASPPVLKLPDHSHLPSLGANISRGNLSIENVATTLAINLDSGNLQIIGGEHDTAANISSGNVSIRQREGDVACSISSGQFTISGCDGDIAINMSKGDAEIRDSKGSLSLQVDKGNVSVSRPIEQHLRIAATKGDVSIQGGSLTFADINVNSGDINSTARLLFTEVAEPAGDDLDDIDEIEDAIGDVADALDEEVRFNLGSVEFIASEAGVRISAGGTERFVAGPEGVQVRRSDGTPVFSANEYGVRVGSSTGKSGSEHFRFRTNRGSISLDISEDQPARVELIVNRGSVQSDIPLVEVGRPGPRSSTRRYVGVSDSSETDRILVRALTNRGDIRVRTARATRETAQSTGVSNRESQRRQILGALAEGRISADEADILLAAMERESG